MSEQHQEYTDTCETVGGCYELRELSSGLYDDLVGGVEGCLRGRAKREGLYVYKQLIPVDVWQKSTQHWKAIILQLKKKKS